ncbi:hypothetical protein ACQHIH_16115 [Xanthomonas sontii]|uniref:hypothetical protein n=1 Tax=Xanthomonas sontii TaxID=2650745 RepID=UPI003F870DDF
MAKFFVGQRVRVVYVKRTENSHLVGQEGHVNEVLQCPWGIGYGLDVRPITHAIVDGGVLATYAFDADQLAPVLPEGQQPCGESYEQLMDRLRSGVVA